MNKTKLEWQKYSLGKLNSKGKWIGKAGTELKDIFHVSHINNALNIFEARKIRAGLVSDKSLLNKERISVVWLSPNNWDGAGGFRYGNVRFQFDWRKLIDNLNFYWIEDIAYSIPAARILITENDYSSKFLKYDPKDNDGPWLYDKFDNLHYWNANICLEIMIERDIYIKETTKIDFVTHHSRFCAIDSNSCPDKGKYYGFAGADFIAAFAARNNAEFSYFFKRHKNRIDISDLNYAFNFICRHLYSLNKNIFRGQIKSSDTVSLAIARAVLSEYVNSDNDDNLNALASLFDSAESLVESCAKLLGKEFNSDWTILMKN